VAPGMHSTLIEEIADAVEDKELYEFSYYLIISRSTMKSGQIRK
jgi:hypothetical protein